MKRKEQIEKAAHQKYPYVGGTKGLICENSIPIFIQGAEWSDKTMVDKACQWIESYLFDIGFPDDWCRDSPNIKSGKERFIKTMLKEE